MHTNTLESEQMQLPVVHQQLLAQQMQPLPLRGSATQIRPVEQIHQGQVVVHQMIDRGLYSQWTIFQLRWESMESMQREPRVIVDLYAVVVMCKFCILWICPLTVSVYIFTEIEQQEPSPHSRY